ncbi:GNAT family N-acetyltransferase [Gallionella capsiferriformans]|uniref:L-ornithine N(alpha)-acyltransferase n=1 Tax=Gallionella capsiferriformans (strain ES-2) TaxID=395494 RepID=D9SDW1_GALCS|nr:GNAT family N-acyltransferase [Gallionella capsiferriformans]ADL56783.1 ornithine-acyl(acyl carrier protein) N-acyltransferase [Gallionella capsiferriformans ES-2]
MLDLIRQPAANPVRRLSCDLATTHTQMQEAQRIRYQVFGEEMGAKLPSAATGLDVDRFDMYCDHLLVRDQNSNKVVGTYRILPPEQARMAGGYYSETEFDMSKLASLRANMAEVGRSCVDADYRDGATITQLWSGLADYITKHGHEYLIGCASMSMSDGGHYAASVFNKVHKLHAAPDEYTVTPHNRLPLESLNGEMEVIIPPLIKGYLRMGAYIAGEPAWDPEFNCADLFILLPVSRITARFSKHFMRKAS